MKIEVGSWKPTMLYQNNEGFEISLISTSERYISLSKSIERQKRVVYL
ncbi:MAG: hypothetical protein IPP49_05910 [Saprospiraceae bacterium]|nr:hypothetical protein [Saprospiraceae bacterium]